MKDRAAARFEDSYVIEPRIRPQIERRGRGDRLVDVSRADQLGSLGGDVANLEHGIPAKLLLNVRIPVLYVGRGKIALNGQRGRRNREGVVGREWVVHQ